MNIFSIVRQFPYSGLFFVLVIGGMGFPFPEGVTLIVTGFLISTGVIKALPGLAIAFSGVLTGDFLSYYLGKKYGRDIVSMKVFKRTLSTRKLNELEKKFDEKGIPFIFIVGRLMSGIFLVAGILEMPFKKILVMDIFSALLGIAIWVGIGYEGGSSLGVITKDIRHLEHVGILVGVVLVVVWLFYKHFGRSRRG